MQEQEHNGIWIWWVLGSWENDGSWATCIQENTLHRSDLKEALFILQDSRCVFISMEALRQALAAKVANVRGTVLFRVNPAGRSIDGKPVAMDAVTSRTYRRQQN